MPNPQIEVTREDLDRSTPNECAMCPIAQALHRMYGSNADPWVNSGVIRCTVDGIRYKAKHTDATKLFIYHVDNEDGVQPESFEVEWHKCPIANP